MKLSDSSGTFRTLKGLFWTFFGTVIQMVLQIIIIAVLARLITPRDFGLVGAATSVIGFSAIFSQLGFGPAIVQRSRLDDSHLRTAFTVSILLGILFILITLLAAPAIAAFFRMKDLSFVVSVLSVTFLFQSLSIVPQSLLQRDLHFKLIARIQVSSYFIGYGLFGVALAYLGKGVWALVIAQIVQSFVSAILYLNNQPCPKRISIDLPAFKELFYFGGGLTLARVGNYISGQGDNVVVGRWLGPVDLGIYARAYQMMVMPATIFGQVLDTVLFPALASIQDNQVNLYKSFRRGVVLLCWLVLPISGLCVVLAPEIISVVLGDSWGNTVAPFRILAVGMFFRTGYMLSDSLTRATAAVYSRAWRQWIFAFLVVVGALIGQYYAGVSGVALGVLIALSVNYFMMAQLSLNLISMTRPAFIKIHLPPLFVTIFISVIIFTIVYLMRLFNIYPVIIILTSLSILSVVSLYLLIVKPLFLLNEDGIWMIQTISGYIRSQLSSYPVFGKYFKSLRVP